MLKVERVTDEEWIAAGCMKADIKRLSAKLEEIAEAANGLATEIECIVQTTRQFSLEFQKFTDKLVL